MSEYDRNQLEAETIATLVALRDRWDRPEFTGAYPAAIRASLDKVIRLVQEGLPPIEAMAMMDVNGPEVVDPELPKGSDPGRILFRLWPFPPGMQSSRQYQFEIDVLDYDSDKAPFWMQEGAGIEYWLDLALDIELEGVYVIESATCTWSKDYWGETDEFWEIGIVRRATDEEIATECLS